MRFKLIVPAITVHFPRPGLERHVAQFDLSWISSGRRYRKLHIEWVAGIRIHQTLRAPCSGQPHAEFTGNRPETHLAIRLPRRRARRRPTAALATTTLSASAALSQNRGRDEDH